jgi:hypothetical protein
MEQACVHEWMKLLPQYNPRGSCDDGRPKVRWKDQKHLQHKEEHVLMDQNLNG